LICPNWDLYFWAEWLGTHTRARTSNRKKNFFVKWTILNRKQNTHRAREKEEKTIYRFSKKKNNNIILYKDKKKIDNSVRKLCLFIYRHHRHQCTYILRFVVRLATKTK
jgi:hypothetical protein